jgi:hypothetical protein
MNKDFFSTLEARAAAFSERGNAETTQVELTLGTGRTYKIEKIIELDDAWFHADVQDVADLDRTVSLAIPYWQIQQVLFVQPRKQMRHAGFVG